MASPGHADTADAVVVGGGTLGGWCAHFLRRAGLDRVVLQAELGIDSGFVSQGYPLPCFTEAEVAAARERMAMQAGLGVPVRWLDPAEVDAWPGSPSPVPAARA
jgi:glycine/D-amino acid oxidase-like deaminating enzyme